VLILDEPTTGLDPNQLQEIRNLIRELGKERTVILSTHIMQEIKAICNRVLIINKGEIVADYPDLSKINFFEENNLQFEVEFLYETEISEIEGINAVSTKDKNTYTVFASKDIRAEIFDFAVKTKNKILMLRTVERSMEEVFRNLTK
jgi:ABC-2 type transport system ATP-binding protein